MEDLIDSIKYSLQPKPTSQWKRIGCAGVGDNNGFYELEVNK